MSDSILHLKVGPLWTYPSMLFRHLLRPEQQPEAGGAGSERQRPGGLWSQTSVCGTEAPILRPAGTLVSLAHPSGSSALRSLSGTPLQGDTASYPHMGEDWNVLSGQEDFPCFLLPVFPVV